MPYSKYEEDLKFMNAQDIHYYARMVHGDGAAVARQASRDFRDGKITDWEVARTIIDGAGGTVADGVHTHKFCENRNESEYLKSDQFFSCPSNQQVLIVQSLAEGVPFDSLEAMGLTEPKAAEKVTVLEPKDIVLLSGAMISQVMSAEEARQVIDSTPEIPDHHEEIKAQAAENPDIYEQIQDANNHVSEAVMTKFAQVTGTEKEDPSFDKPDLGKRLLSYIGVMDYISESPVDLKRLVTVDGAYRNEVAPEVYKNQFNSFKRSNNYKTDLDSLKDASKGIMKGQRRDLCKQVYQAYKNGTIKDPYIASNIIDAIAGRQLEDKNVSWPYAMIGDKEIEFMTSKEFGLLPPEQQQCVAELLYRGVGLDNVEKIGLLDNTKDKEQFFFVGEDSTQAPRPDGVRYNFSEVNLIAGAIEAGVPPEDIKEVLDSLPYSTYEKCLNAREEGKEQTIPRDYVGDNLAKKMLESYGYKDFKDSPMQSLEKTKHILEDIGHGKLDGRDVKKQFSLNTLNNKTKGMQQAVDAHKKENPEHKQTKAKGEEIA